MTDRPCRKVTYTSKKQARQAARRYLATVGGHGMEAYYHAECERWHLGHERGQQGVPCRTRRAPIIFGPAAWGGMVPLDPDTGLDHQHRSAAA